MTPLTVQMSLIDELKDMFKGYEYKNAKILTPDLAQCLRR